jgi:hypothetical protein
MTVSEVFGIAVWENNVANVTVLSTFLVFLSQSLSVTRSLIAFSSISVALLRLIWAQKCHEICFHYCSLVGGSSAMSTVFR